MSKAVNVSKRGRDRKEDAVPRESKLKRGGGGRPEDRVTAPSRQQRVGRRLAMTSAHNQESRKVAKIQAKGKGGERNSALFTEGKIESKQHPK